jgi:hypothetical protein
VSDKAETTYIYALKDPRTGHARYVGSTTQPEARLRSHHTSANAEDRNETRRWLGELRNLGLRAEMAILETTTSASRVDAENHWIGKLRAAGELLSNMRPAGRCKQSTPQRTVKSGVRVAVDIAPVTQYQLEDLKAAGWGSFSDIVQIAIDRLSRDSGSHYRRPPGSADLHRSSAPPSTECTERRPER